jgi:spoIIIJ-associated protein
METPPVVPSRAELAKERLMTLLGHLKVGAEVGVAEVGEEITLHVRLGEGAPEVGLSGERPPMQEPLAYLLSKMVNRGAREGGPRAFIRLDLGQGAPPGDEVDEELLALGKGLAVRAKLLGKTLTVGPMTARERRSVHLAVKEEGGATTRSEGEGFLRRILIVPL